MKNNAANKMIQELNLEDDFLFAKVMSDKEVCRKVLEKILNVPIREVILPSTQRTIDILFESKGIRLDCYVNDDKKTVYNVEMQRGKRKGLPKRSRYYQGSIDPFSDGRHLYTFENTCSENPKLLLGDETTKIFLNTKGILDDVDDEMREFLFYVENTTDAFAMQAASPLIKEIHKKVTEVKLSKEMEVEYMTQLQRDRENIEQGLEKGAKIISLHLFVFPIAHIKKTSSINGYRLQGSISVKAV